MWNNVYITSNRNSLFWREWYSHGVTRIHDIIHNNGDFLSHTEIQNKYNVQCNFLNVLQLRQSIPIKWRQLLREENTLCNITEECHLTINNTQTDIKTLKCKDYYWMFVEKNKQRPTCLEKWSEFYPEMYNEDRLWQNLFRQPFKITRETKLQSFQYRILHRIVPCNKWLYNLKIKQSSKCTYCENEDTIIHFFLHCNKVNDLWNYFFNWWNNICEFKIINPIEECIIFGFQGKGTVIEVLNYCILLCKYYIYKQRLYGDNKLDLYEFLVQLKYKLKIEKTICDKDDRIKFTKWLFLYDNL